MPAHVIRTTRKGSLGRVPAFSVKPGFDREFAECCAFTHNLRHLHSATLFGLASVYRRTA